MSSGPSARAVQGGLVTCRSDAAGRPAGPGACGPDAGTKGRTTQRPRPTMRSLPGRIATAITGPAAARRGKPGGTWKR
jgi:hypothetical protein